MMHQHVTRRGIQWLIIIGIATTLCVSHFGSHQASADGRKTKDSITKHMHGMKNQLKSAAGKLQDSAAADDVLENVQAMMAHMMDVRLLDPPGLDAVPKADQARRQREFRLAATRVLRELVDMEIDLLEGRSKDAMKRVTGPLYRLREAAHGEFQPK